MTEADVAAVAACVADAGRVVTKCADGAAAVAGLLLVLAGC